LPFYNVVIAAQIAYDFHILDVTMKPVVPVVASASDLIFLVLRVSFHLVGNASLHCFVV